MEYMTTTEAARQIGKSVDLAIQEPVTLTRHGRSVAVLVSERHYQQLCDALCAVVKQQTLDCS